MKNKINISTLLAVLLFCSLLFTSCNNKTATSNANESNKLIETSETIKEFITNNDVFVLDENSDKPKPNNAYPSNTPPGFVNPDGSIPGVPKAPGGMGPQEKPESYNAVETYDVSDTISSLKVESTAKDENAILVDNKANLILNKFDIKRISDNSTGGDLASFYGVGAAALTINGNLYMDNGKIETDSNGGAGVFAYDKGIANLTDVTINTKKDTSGAIHVAGGGTLSAKNVTATTDGNSSAAIRSDRGGGRMVINGGTYTTNGVGSPALYCTADITVDNAKLISNNSEGICIEGKNTTTLNNVDLTSSMHDDDQNDNTWSIIVYQSMSGDSEVGKGVFTMNGGTIKSTSGGIFYTTNTESEFNLNGVDIKKSDDSEFLLQVTGNTNKRGWGSAGKNGAKCTFNAINQVLEGDIIVDSISSLDLNLQGAAILTGNIIMNDKFTGGVTGDGYVNVNMAENTSWIISQDMKINKLTYKGEIVDDAYQIVPIYDTQGNLLIDGISGLKITVDEFEE